MFKKSKNNSGNNKRIAIVFATVLVLILLYTCLVVPFYISTAKNVLFSDSIIPLLLYILKTVIECAITAILFGYAARSVFLERQYNSKGYRAKIRFYGFIVPAIFIFAEFVLNQIVAFITKEINEFTDVFAGLATPVLDTLLVLVVAVIARSGSEKYLKRAKDVEKAARYVAQDTSSVCEPVFPFSSFVSLGNPVLKAIFIGSALLGFSLICQRVFIDIGYGAPTSVNEIREMMLYYLSDLLQAVAVYTGAYFTAAFLSE